MIAANDLCGAGAQGHAPLRLGIREQKEQDMPRRGGVVRREIEPDPKYGNVMVAKFVNKLMMRGKKSLARRIFYESCDLIEQRTRKNPIEVFEQAVQNAAPLIEVKPRRVGGATYQVPVEVSDRRRISLGIRWLLRSVKRRVTICLWQERAGIGS